MLYLAIEAGVSPDKFWNLTLYELSAILQVHRRKAEMNERLEWERTRWHAFITIQPNLGKGSNIKKPADLVQFPWEGQTKKQIITGAPLREMLNKYGKKSGS